MTSPTDVFDPSALIALLPTLLHPTSKSLASSQDGIAALLHTILTAVAFRLIAVDETSAADPTLANVLPPTWNKDGPGHYTFRYKHDQSSLEFVIKVSRLGARTVINAIAVESDEVAALHLTTDDFVSPSFFPQDLSSSTQPLIHGFISSNRVADLASQIKLKIIQHLVPGLRKDGYVEIDSSTNAGGSNSRRPQNPAPARPQPGAPPHAPDNTYRPPSMFPPNNPLEIGRSDLDPFPINPFSPPALFPHGGDGMFVGPDHPIFGARGGRNPFGETGPWGGDGFLPPMGAPPGARFDPVGPGPLPGRGGFTGPGRGRGGGRNFGSPDNDEFMPPGMGDMFS